MGRRGRRARGPRGRLSIRLRPGEWGVIPLALGLVFLPALRTGDLPPPIRVRVADSIRMFAPGTTLGSVRDRMDLEPPRGDLLDVEGVPLMEGRFPGHLRVNGEQAGGGLVLQDGDIVSLARGEDRTEATERRVIVTLPGRPTNPQTFIGSQPGEQIIVTGRRSGKVVSSEFRPSGPAKQPREVALTFDDGPSPTWTPRILNVLKRKKAKATFFVVGSMAARYPDLVRRERAMGMAVGNHTMSHPFRKPFRRQRPRALEREIELATSVLAELGVRPSTFRPPGGSWSPRVLEAARRVDQRVILWSVDSRDWAGRTAKQIAEAVLRDVRPGAIVLLHDGGGNRRPTLEALPRIITGLRRMRLKLVTL